MARTRNNPLIDKFKSVGQGAHHHIYTEGEGQTKKLHIYPYDQHPSKKDVETLGLGWVNHQDINEVTDDWIERVGEDNFIFHENMSSEDYASYLKK